ncbi:MAG: FAD-binding protein [Ruminococcus sp.]|nr:FAD-binding protein [Ruminococcus sp.]
MIILNNEPLSKRTTFHIGGTAEKLYIPESEEELIQVSKDIYDRDHRVYVISGGSNLLINDDRAFPEVVCMAKACRELEQLHDGVFYIGASVRIQKAISFVNSFGYGGFEELIGLPALFGGIIYMNAGIGRESAPLFTISEFVDSVRALDLKTGETVTLTAEECRFGHRTSVFKNGQYIILGAQITCRATDRDDAASRIQKWREYCHKSYEYGKGCFGSCFMRFKGPILRTLSALYKKGILKYSGKVRFANNNANWLVNEGGGTYKDAMTIINRCKKLHKLAFQKLECEVIIWD